MLKFRSKTINNGKEWIIETKIYQIRILILDRHLYLLRSPTLKCFFFVFSSSAMWKKRQGLQNQMHNRGKQVT